jgi:hypothetical protein
MKKLDYLILSIIFVSGLILFFIFSYNSHYQRNVIYGTSGLYFLWSLYHHYQKGDLHPSIVLEYLLFILLGLIVLSSTFL